MAPPAAGEAAGRARRATAPSASVRLVRAQFSFTLTRPTTSVLADLGGGALLDVGCYCVSALRLVAGEPDRLRPEGGRARRRGRALHGDRCASRAVRSATSTAASTCRCAGARGGRLRTACSSSSPPSGATRRARPAARRRRAGADRPARDAPLPARGRELLRATRGEEAPLLDRAESVAQARALEALLRSAETDRPASS